VRLHRRAAGRADARRRVRATRARARIIPFATGGTARWLGCAASLCASVRGRAFRDRQRGEGRRAEPERDSRSLRPGNALILAFSQGEKERGSGHHGGIGFTRPNGARKLRKKERGSGHHGGIGGWVAYRRGDRMAFPRPVWEFPTTTHRAVRDPKMAGGGVTGSVEGLFDATRTDEVGRDCDHRSDRVPSPRGRRPG
jgi:hypothetical protein